MKRHLVPAVLALTATAALARTVPGDPVMQGRGLDGTGTGVIARDNSAM